MSQIESQNIPEPEQTWAQSSAKALVSAKQSKFDLISKLTNPQLQKLAQMELQELESLEAEMS